MEKAIVARYLAWAGFLIAVIGGLISYRYFRIAPDLRWPQDEALWLTLPYVVLAILALVLILVHVDNNNSSSDKS